MHENTSEQNKTFDITKSKLINAGINHLDKCIDTQENELISIIIEDIESTKNLVESFITKVTASEDKIKKSVEDLYNK